jgi:rubrerythrin
MNKITTKAELIDMIENILALERKARDDYKKDAEIFKTENIVKTLKHIELDEERHIKMLEALIFLLKKD